MRATSSLSAPRKTVATPRLCASATSAAVKAAAIPRRRAAGSVATPTISVTPPTGWCVPTAIGPVSSNAAKEMLKPRRARSRMKSSTAGVMAAARSSRSFVPSGPICVPAAPKPMCATACAAANRSSSTPTSRISTPAGASICTPTRASRTSNGYAWTNSPLSRAAEASDGVVSATHSMFSGSFSLRCRSRSKSTFARSIGWSSPSLGLA